MRVVAPMQSALEPKSYAVWRTPKGTFRRLKRFINATTGRADNIGNSAKFRGGFYVSMDACGRDRDTDLRVVFSSAG